MVEVRKPRRKGTKGHAMIRYVQMQDSDVRVFIRLTMTKARACGAVPRVQVTPSSMHTASSTARSY